MSRKIKNAIRTLKLAFEEDEGFRFGYQSAIAMAFVDNYRWYQEKHNKKVLNNKEIHETANYAANYFLNLWTEDKERLINDSI
jgi:hypothetical protein